MLDKLDKLNDITEDLEEIVDDMRPDMDSDFNTPAYYKDIDYFSESIVKAEIWDKNIWWFR